MPGNFILQHSLHNPFSFPSRLSTPAKTLSQIWFNSAEVRTQFCWNPHGKLNENNFSGEIRLRTMLRRSGPTFEQPRYSFLVEEDPSLAVEGEIDFPDNISMFATEKILQWCLELPIQKNKERVCITPDSLMTLAGYKKGEWQMELKIVRPAIMIDSFYHEPKQPLELEFIKATSDGWKEKIFTKSYKVCFAQLKDKDICVVSDGLLFDPHRSDTMELFIVDDKKTILEPDSSGGFNPLLMKQFLTGNYDNMYMVTLKDGRYMEFEKFEFPEELVINAENHMITMQENMARLDGLKNGLWLIDGKDTHIEKIDMQIDYEKDMNKKVFKQHRWNTKNGKKVVEKVEEEENAQKENVEMENKKGKRRIRRNISNR